MWKKRAEDPDDLAAKPPSSQPRPPQDVDGKVNEVKISTAGKKKTETMEETELRSSGVQKSSKTSPLRQVPVDLDLVEAYCLSEDEDSSSDKPGAFGVSGIRGMDLEADGTVRIGAGSTPDGRSLDGEESKSDEDETNDEPLLVAELAPRVAECTVVPQRQRWKEWKVTIVLLVLAVLAGAVAISVVALLKGNNPTTTMPSQIPIPSKSPSPTTTPSESPTETASPSSEPTTAPSVPTDVPSFEPTNAPSSEPTTTLDNAIAVFAPFIAGISNSTISNVQAAALEWLIENDNGLVEAEDSYGILERYSLAVLYFATEGDFWIDKSAWLSRASVCAWANLPCSDGRVSWLDLNSNRLEGSIPSEIGYLLASTRLDMWNNIMTENIPTEMGQLTVVAELNLFQNALTGSTPSELGLMTSLTWLNLADNILSSAIPIEIGQLTDLRTMALENNALSGNIPTELFSSSLSALTWLTLQNNNLDGAIPTEISNLALQVLALEANELSGVIPTTIGNLTALESLNIRDNNLSGTLPTELGRLTALTSLWLYNNNLQGSVPSELYTLLVSLSACRLDGNPDLMGVPSNCL